MHPIRALFALCLLAGGGFARGQRPPLGSPAPTVKAAKTLQGKPLARFEKGKVYVLEFWATWCGTCRPAIPHLNDLAAKFAGKPVEIYSVTDESAAAVEPFLVRYPMRTNLVVGAGDLVEAFGVRLLPTTVLIDKAGRIAAFTQPEAVTEKTLNALLAGGKIDVPVASDKPAALDWDESIMRDSVGHVLVRFSDSDGGGQRIPPNSGRITADGVGLAQLLQIANDVESVDTRWDAPKDETRYRISVKAADGKDATAREMLADALARTFRLRAEWQMIEREVEILSATGAITLAPPVTPKDDDGARQGRILWPSADSKLLARLLASYGVGRTVVDETGLTGQYAIALKWTPGDRASLEKALAAYGLRIRKETRKVPTFVVSPRGKG